MTTKKKIFKIFIIVFAVLVAGFVGISAYIGLEVSKVATHLTEPETTALDRQGRLEERNISYDELEEEYIIEQISIDSTFDDHTIPADYIKTDDNTQKDTAILVHGLGGNRLSVYPVALMFLEMGYNVITYDQRSSGENTAEYNTFGYWERYDLLDYVNYVKGLQGEDNKIVAWGTSFGGATVAMALGVDDSNIDYAILDCPLSEADYMISQELDSITGSAPVTNYMLLMCNLANKVKLGFSLSEVDAPSIAKDTTTPVLIFNSHSDTVTPYFMGKAIYDSLNTKDKELVTVEDSIHTQIFFDHRDLYESSLKEFLAQY